MNRRHRVDLRPELADELAALVAHRDEGWKLLREFNRLMERYHRVGPLEYEGPRPGEFAERLMAHREAGEAAEAAFMAEHFSAKRWAGWYLLLSKRTATIASSTGLASVVLWEDRSWRGLADDAGSPADPDVHDE